MSGTVNFASGAKRSSDGEHLRYDLISPIGLTAVARTCAEGAAKYGDCNWELGMPAHQMINRSMRHINLWLAGDRSEPHLPHAAWGILGAIHSLALWPEINKGTLRGPGCTITEEQRKGLAAHVRQETDEHWATEEIPEVATIRSGQPGACAPAQEFGIKYCDLDSDDPSAWIVADNHWGNTGNALRFTDQAAAEKWMRKHNYTPDLCEVTPL